MTYSNATSEHEQNWARLLSRYHLPLPVSGSGSSPAGEGGRPLSPSLYSLPLPVSGLGSSPAGEGGRPITHKQTGQFIVLRQRKRSEGCVKHMSHKRNSTRSCPLTLARDTVLLEREGANWDRFPSCNLSRERYAQRKLRSKTWAAQISSRRNWNKRRRRRCQSLATRLCPGPRSLKGENNSPGQRVGLGACQTLSNSYPTLILLS